MPIDISQLHNWEEWGYSKGIDENNKTIDCSHLVHQIMAINGVYYNYRTCQGFLNSPPEQFEKISQQDAKEGDIIIYGTSHMGIYLDEIYCFSSQSQGSKQGPNKGKHSYFPGERKYYRLKQ